MQPLVLRDDGELCFKENKIVRLLLDTGKLNLNDLAYIEFSNDDRAQFAQLIGYSLAGFGELSYVDGPTWTAAQEMAEVRGKEG